MQESLVAEQQQKTRRKKHRSKSQELQSQQAAAKDDNFNFICYFLKLSFLRWSCSFYRPKWFAVNCRFNGRQILSARRPNGWVLLLGNVRRKLIKMLLFSVQSKVKKKKKMRKILGENYNSKHLHFFRVGAEEKKKMKNNKSSQTWNQFADVDNKPSPSVRSIRCAHDTFSLAVQSCRPWRPNAQHMQYACRLESSAIMEICARLHCTYIGWHTCVSATTLFIQFHWHLSYVLHTIFP